MVCAACYQTAATPCNAGMYVIDFPFLRSLPLLAPGTSEMSASPRLLHHSYSQFERCQRRCMVEPLPGSVTPQSTGFAHKMLSVATLLRRLCAPAGGYGTHEGTSRQLVTGGTSSHVASTPASVPGELFIYKTGMTMAVCDIVNTVCVCAYMCVRHRMACASGQGCIANGH